MNMKGTFYLKQKTKIALLLFCIMACSILINFLEDKSVKDMNISYRSLYNDRLVPSILLHEINIIAIEKNQSLANFLKKTTNADLAYLLTQLEAGNKRIDSTISVYEQTYLVDTEIIQLKNLKDNLNDIKKYESFITRLLQNGKFEAAQSIYELEGQSLNLHTTNLVTSLMAIHIKVGHDMMDDVENIVSGTKLYSSLQIGLAILIGLLIMNILFAVKSTRTAAPKDYHLN